MQITVFAGAVVIGTGHIYALDPPMCVAMARFQPTESYDVMQHAGVVNGEWVEDRTQALSIRLGNGDRLTCESISMQDWPELPECEIHLLGISEPPFELLFGDHPDFKAYWD